MEQTIIIQGVNASDFYKQVEEASYRGQQRAIEEEKNLGTLVNWNKYPDLMNTESVSDVFDIHIKTALNWIKAMKFGDYMEDDRLYFVHKKSVKKDYESRLIKSKR